MRRGARVLADRSTRQGHIILVSDGFANTGASSPDALGDLAFKFLNEGISISTIGIVNDLHAEILGTIAQQGGGLFHHCPDGTLEEIFQDELRQALSSPPRETRIRIQAPGWAADTNLNDFRQTNLDTEWEIVLGTLVRPVTV